MEHHGSEPEGQERGQEERPEWECELHPEGLGLRPRIRDAADSDRPGTAPQQLIGHGPISPRWFEGESEGIIRTLLPGARPFQTNTQTSPGCTKRRILRRFSNRFENLRDGPSCFQDCLGEIAGDCRVQFSSRACGPGDEGAGDEN